MRVFVILCLALGALAVAPNCTVSNLLPKSDVQQAGFCPFIWSTGLNGPRGMIIAKNNDVLVCESGYSQITALWDANNDGKSDNTERAVLAKQSGLNHGVAISVSGGYLYASSETDVYRWRYTAGNRTSLGTGQHVIANLPCCHHTTRTLLFSPDESQLYVQSGSGDNVDPDPTHAEIRRWNVSSFSTSASVDWSTGQLLASGMRNEVGLRFDPNGVLWGVENGVDDVARSDWGIGDIHNDNPCEELNRFDVANPGRFYGYPYCWSEGILPSPPGKGAGTQWLHSNFNNTAPYSDAWCQNTANVVPPAHCLPAHNAPLDIFFGSIVSVTGYDMTAYVSAHGSWDRDTPDGYRVYFVTWKSGVISHTPFLQYAGPGATGTGWPRPVSMTIAPCPWGSCLLISTDSNNEIIAVGYNVK
jgi:glucose/arabinose dehydrogenase